MALSLLSMLSATLIAVKVFNDAGFGSTADIVAGLDYVLAAHAQRGSRGSVVSMSLGGPRNAVLDEAVLATYDGGVTVVAVAGNSVK